jgi:aspartate aminotransferase-like enzyme
VVYIANPNDFRLTKKLEELVPSTHFPPLSGFDKHNDFFHFGAGPTNISPNVHRASASGIVSHGDSELREVLRLTQQSALALFDLDPERKGYFAMLTTGTGTASESAAFYNMLEIRPSNLNDVTFVINQGFFGDRIEQILSLAQIPYESIKSPWGTSTDPNQVEDRLRNLKAAGKNVSTLVAVLVETSTGVRDPNTKNYADAYQRLFPDGYVILDAVSGTGGFPISMDRSSENYSGADVVFTGVQKGLGSLQGLSIVVFNERSKQKAIAPKGARVFYLDAEMHAKYQNMEPMPKGFVYTFPHAPLFALYQAFKDVHDNGGFESLHQRVASASRQFDMNAEAMGFEHFVSDHALRALTIHTLRPPHGTEIPAYLKRLRESKVIINPGLRPEDGIVRVGLLGDVNTGSSRIADLNRYMERALR